MIGRICRAGYKLIVTSGEAFPFRACGALCAGIWLYLALFRGAFWRLRERLETAEPLRDTSVTAVIPARNEASFAGLAVTSLRLQAAGEPLRVIVADDESTDETAARAREAGADLVVDVGIRPDGWKGKLWAVESGIRAETHAPEYYLLTDADIEHT